MELMNWGLSRSIMTSYATTCRQTASLCKLEKSGSKVFEQKSIALKHNLGVYIPHGAPLKNIVSYNELYYLLHNVNVILWQLHSYFRTKRKAKKCEIQPLKMSSGIRWWWEALEIRRFLMYNIHHKLFLSCKFYKARLDLGKRRIDACVKLFLCSNN